MNYGFSAQPQSTDNAVDFNAMKQAVIKQEAEYHASVEARLKHRAEEANR